MAFDANLMLRTTGTLTALETLGPVVLYGGEIDGGLAIRTIVPSAYGINDTIWPKVLASTDGSTYNLIAEHPKGAQKPGTGSLDLIVPFTLPPGKWYVEAVLAVTIASTTPTFGTVTVGVVLNPGFDQDRSAYSSFR